VGVQYRVGTKERGREGRWGPSRPFSFFGDFHKVVGKNFHQARQKIPFAANIAYRRAVRAGPSPANISSPHLKFES
jgi:hypothetical protein